MITVQREVKGDLPLEQEDSCLAILGETKIKGEKEEEEEECLLVKPELIDEEAEMRKKNLAAFKKEEAAEQELVAELTAEERFAKLTELLSKSKFYAKFLYDKLQQEDEETKRIKADKLKERRSLTENSDSKKSGSLKRTRLSVGNDVTKKAKLSPRMFNDEPIAEEQPLLISGGVMRGYQIEGYQWMANLYENGINGILADEMGLGKTIQTIALFAHLVEMGVSGPFLIIAPLSTITNWIKEFKKFAPLLPAVLYHGNAKEREDLRGLHLAEVHKIREGFNNPRTARNIFVTSYEIAMNDRVHFRKINWRYIVVDEGHRLKNTNCRLIKELRLYTSANRLLLTGTPLQNNLDELWSLLNFLMAEIFDDLRVFKSWFNAKDMDVEGEDEKKRILQQERQGSILSTLHQILTPFLLRRVKADVDLKIPPKKEVLVYCPMTEVQRVFYEATVNQTISAIVKPAQTEEAAPDLDSNGRPIRSCPKFDYKAILEHEDQESDANFEKYTAALQTIEEEKQRRLVVTSAYQRNVRESSDVKVSVKNRMMDLRKCTNHPYLIEYPLSEDGVFYRTDEEIVEKCGKLKVLDQMLSELLKRGHKVLIFSQMTRMLDILGDYLNLRGCKFSRLDGSMHFVDRQVNIDAFNETDGVNIFLLSTRAGGLGINLTAADTCIIYDSDWNPQQDLQAQDRCHRIGQTKPVMVYRLVTANTIDERIVERAAAKRKLEKLIIHRKKFKSQDLNGLTATMEAISPQELLELLESKDHAGVMDREDGTIFSEEELNLLLDRSDLTWSKIAEKENTRRSSTTRGKKSASIVPPKMTPKVKATNSGLFKIIDTEGLPTSLLESVGTGAASEN